MIVCPSSCARSRHEGGQAAVFAVLTLPVVALVILFLFNAGQLSGEKMRLRNTADAAAYSGALVEARELNFMAYTNRAMVANQVAVAQMVSMVSWTAYLHRTADNIATVTSWIPVVNAITRAVEQAAQYAENYTTRVADIGITAENYLLEGLYESQEKVHLASTYTVADTVKRVVQLNDSKARLSTFSVGALAQHGVEWFNLLKQYDDSKGLQRFADVTMASRDGFSRERSETLFNIPGFVHVRLEKRGGTELQNAKTWSGIDTLALHLSWPCLKGGFFKHLSTCRSELPIGWGAAQSGDEADFLPGDYGRSEPDNPETTDIAIRYAKTGIGTYDGIRPYYDFSDLSTPHYSTPGLLIEVSKPADAIRTSSRVGMGAGRLRLDDGEANDEMTVLAKAEAYFQRPDDRWPRADGKEEYGNLFNPYWQAHLVDSTSTERLAAMAFRR